MPPIRTFKSAPINPNSAAHTTTNTDDSQQGEQQQQQDDSNTTIPAWTLATPTAAMNTGGGYPAAKPGAYAVPAPTSSASSSYITPTKTYPYTTDEKQSDSPPAPQPGSRPVITTPSSSSSPLSSTPSTSELKKTAKTTVPPPPKKGEPVQQASYYAPRATNTQSPSTQHPQQPYVVSTYQGPQLQSQYQQQLPQPSTQPSILDNTFGEGTSAAGQDMLNTAKSWMASAGSKLAEAEEEVWRMVNSGSKS